MGPASLPLTAGNTSLSSANMSLVNTTNSQHYVQAGKLYLVNLGIPRNIYKEVGIKFSSPFGAKFVIPLHDAWFYYKIKQKDNCVFISFKLN